MNLEKILNNIISVMGFFLWAVALNVIDYCNLYLYNIIMFIHFMSVYKLLSYLRVPMYILIIL